MDSSQEKCPVDHSALASSSKAEICPVDHSSFNPSSADKCPVDQTTRWSWTNLFGSSKDDSANAHPPAQNPSGTHPRAPSHLPTEREISSIPRADGSKWVYPSQAQFYSAMERKNHNPQATDMQVVVPIHNAVNERAWAEVMKWEQNQGGDKCGGVKLVSFKGKPNERTPRARWKMLLGYVCFRYVHTQETCLFILLAIGTPLRSIVMTGLSTVAERESVTSSTFTQVVVLALQVATSRFTSTSVQLWTVGKVFAFEPKCFGIDGQTVSGLHLRPLLHLRKATLLHRLAYTHIIVDTPCNASLYYRTYEHTSKQSMVRKNH